MTVAVAARREWLLPTGLIVLSIVPVLFGAIRVAELSTGPEVTEDNARFVAAPVPVLLHIVCASVYCILGAFQFVPGIRRRRPGWHRASGRLLVPCGLMAALTGLWMTLFYEGLPGDGALLAGMRLMVGSAMALAIALGWLAARRRDFTRHRAWMIRGYALGIGAGTQVFTTIPVALAVGPPSGTTRALLLGAGWLINITVAELVIRNRTPYPQRRLS